MGIKMVLSVKEQMNFWRIFVFPQSAKRKRIPRRKRKLGKLHMYDCLRANKSLAAWGIEGRVPFLDKEFMDVAMRVLRIK
jgi:asparagine synthase (glutamine-hydrolysing)